MEADGRLQSYVHHLSERADPSKLLTETHKLFRAYLRRDPVTKFEIARLFISRTDLQRRCYYYLQRCAARTSRAEHASVPVGLGNLLLIHRAAQGICCPLVSPAICCKLWPCPVFDRSLEARHNIAIFWISCHGRSSDGAI